MTDDQRNAHLAHLDTATNALMEHFDTVQIFVTRQEDGGDNTIRASKGAGNWYARYGHVKAWILAEDAILEKEAVTDPDNP